MPWRNALGHLVFARHAVVGSKNCEAHCIFVLRLSCAPGYAWVLMHVDPVPRRVIIIGGGVLYFANPVTPVNVVGMVAAVAGVTLYNLARRWTKPVQRQAALGKPHDEEHGRTSPESEILADAQSDAEAGRSAGLLIPSAVEGSTGGSSSHQFPEGRLAARSQAVAAAGSRSDKPPRWASPGAMGSTALRIAAHRSAFGARNGQAGPGSVTDRPLRRFRTPSGGAWDGQSPQSELTPVADGELVRVTSFS